MPCGPSADQGDHDPGLARVASVGGCLRRSGPPRPGGGFGFRFRSAESCPWEGLEGGPLVGPGGL
jgi:hypothetical protein